MTLEQIQKQLEKMKGQTFDYAKNRHTVTNYMINADDGVFTIITDKDRYKRKFESAKEFLSYWYYAPNDAPAENKKPEPIKNTEVQNANNTAVEIRPKKALVTDEVTNNLVDDLVNILKKNIENVTSDPKYVKQAQEVNSSVNTIIMAKRMQLDVFKSLNGLNKNQNTQSPKQ